MYKLVVLAIAGSLLCGAAVADKKQAYEACTANEDCYNNCCFGGSYCSPSVSLDGTCASKHLEEACGNPSSDLAKAACPKIEKVIELVPVIQKKGLLPDLLSPLKAVVGTIIKLLEDVLDLNPLLGGLVFLLKLVFHILGGVGFALGDVLGAVNYLVDTLLTGLLA